MPDVAFEWTYCVEKIILSLFFFPTEVTNLLCMHSRRHARHSVRTHLLRGNDDIFSFLRFDESNKLTLHA